MNVNSLQYYIPGKDYTESKQFYRDFGFSLVAESEEVCEFKAGNASFLLQNYYQKEWAENTMLQLVVDDVYEAWNSISNKLLKKYKHIMAKEPKREPWGAIVAYVWGPSGELWHISQRSAVVHSFAGKS